MSLTCISCKLMFSGPELYHDHYKSDWHRYNLKRKIAQLPPLTKEEFEERAAAFEASNKNKEKLYLKCNACNKSFSSENAMSNHLKSKRHLAIAGSEKRIKFPGKGRKLASVTKSDSKNVGVMDNNASDEECSGTDSDWESCDEEDDVDVKKIVIDTNDCLFCDHHSNSTENNVAHMTKVHSFFIPDIEYLVNLDALIAFLAGKIHMPHICLWCNGKGKGFRSVKSVRQHMIDKGHCKMLHEGETLLEYADFYDYSTSDFQPNFEEDTLTDLLENADYELVLPSGAVIGHRSLSIYYKQNLKPAKYDNETKVKKIISQYKSLGYTGCTGPAAVTRAKDITYMHHLKSRYYLKLGVKNNKMQPHFRQQVMF